MAEMFPQMFFSIAQGSGGTTVTTCLVSRPGHHWHDRQLLWTMVRHNEQALKTERAVYEYLAELLKVRAENYT